MSDDGTEKKEDRSKEFQSIGSWIGGILIILMVLWFLSWALPNRKFSWPPGSARTDTTPFTTTTKQDYLTPQGEQSIVLQKGSPVKFQVDFYDRNNMRLIRRNFNWRLDGASYRITLYDLQGREVSRFDSTGDPNLHRTIEESAIHAIGFIQYELLSEAPATLTFEISTPE